MSNPYDPSNPLKDAPVSVREAFLRVKGHTTNAPWLRQPVYHRFVVAMNPKADRSKFDPYQRGLWAFAFEGKPLVDEMEPVEMALSYWNSSLIRSHLNALFFGGAKVEEVAKSTNLETLSVDAYKRLFCETDVFNGAPLLLMEYIHRMPELSDSDRDEKNLYRMAVDFGWQWVVWKLTRGMEGHTPGVTIVDAMANLAFWRAMEAAVSPLNTTGAKEGRHYMKLAADLSISKHNSKMGEVSSIRDLALKLLAENPGTYDETHFDEPTPEVSELLYEDPDRED